MRRTPFLKGTNWVDGSCWFEVEECLASPSKLPLQYNQLHEESQ
jgi:hypothetical protein